MTQEAIRRGFVASMLDINGNKVGRAEVTK